MTDDLDLFTELEKLKTDSVILSASPDIPILSDKDFPDDSAMPAGSHIPYFDCGGQP